MLDTPRRLFDVYKRVFRFLGVYSTSADIPEAFKDVFATSWGVERSSNRTLVDVERMFKDLHKLHYADFGLFIPPP